uniref:Methionine adenosyltransferase 2 subunit beta n=1 Tax=Timema californicum TaxID=61474 RepID=A0A7R9IX89_TIMCA|nr:unnamed protein product [Timema californicum]
METLLDTSKKQQVSNFEKRNPSHVDDIAVICYSLARKRLQRENISGIYQWCGKETLTKYEMVLQMAGVFNLPHSHITPASDPPALSSAVRPYDTRLDTTRVELRENGMFRDWWEEEEVCFNRQELRENGMFRDWWVEEEEEEVCFNRQVSAL